MGKEALGLVDKMIVMGASMDGKLLKEAAAAHHKAIGSIDAKGVTSAADYEAVNGPRKGHRVCATVSGHGRLQCLRQDPTPSCRQLQFQQRQWSRRYRSLQGPHVVQGCCQGRTGLSWLKRQQSRLPILITTFKFKDVAKAAQV